MNDLSPYANQNKEKKQFVPWLGVMSCIHLDRGTTVVKDDYRRHICFWIVTERVDKARYVVQHVKSLRVELITSIGLNALV